MTELVKIRGLSRKGVRIGSGRLVNSVTRVVDLDDAVTRRDLSHHSAIGQFITVGDTDVAVSSGVVASAGTTLSYSVSAGVLLLENGSTVTVGAVSNVALTAADVTNPRIDLIHVDKSSGAVAKTDGTAAASPKPPSAPSGKVAVAQVLVVAGATTLAGTTYTDVAPRLS